MPHNDMSKEAAEQILELPQRYTKEDLRHAYTEAARTYHPDAAAKLYMSPDEAQRLMVEVNKAHDVLKQQFVDRPNRVVERVSGIANGYADVDWLAGVHETAWDDENPWDFAEDWGAEPAPQEVPLSVRSVLLGPVVLRVLFIAGFAWLWWNTFPLLAHNVNRFVPAQSWTPHGVARVVTAFVYPSYLLVYELVSGYISGFVREILNGAVSWLTRRYVDLRPHTSSYGCALYKLLREQVYGLLMAPIVVWLVAFAMEATLPVCTVLFGALAAVLGIDMLAAFVRGGFINTGAIALAERIEARYLLIRADLLKRCGQWGGDR